MFPVFAHMNFCQMFVFEETFLFGFLYLVFCLALRGVGHALLVNGCLSFQRIVFVARASMY